MTLAFLYKWTQLSTGKWYVGSRTAKNCHPGDGYICSSKIVKPMILETPDDWERTILAIGQSKYIVEMERKYLELVDAASDNISFNKHNANGKFITPNIPLSEETKRKISDNLKGKKKGPMSLEHKAKLSESKKGRTAPNKGKPMSQEQKDKIAKAHLGKKRNPHCEETKRKISESEKKTKSMRNQKNPDVNLDIVI